MSEFQMTDREIARQARLEFERKIDYMNTAIGQARLSEDLSTQNGAIIVSGEAIVAWGVNNIPVDVTDERLQPPLKYAYTEHAERSAIYYAAAKGEPLEGSEMYCPWAACASCARAIALTGIEKLIRLPMPESGKWNQSVTFGDIILREAGVEVEELSISNVNTRNVRLGNLRERYDG